MSGFGDGESEAKEDDEEEDGGFGGGLRKLCLRRKLESEIGVRGGISAISPSFWEETPTFRIELNSHLHGSENNAAKRVWLMKVANRPCERRSSAQNRKEIHEEQALILKAQGDWKEGTVGDSESTPRSAVIP